MMASLARLWGVYAYLDFLFIMKDARRFVILFVSDAALGVAFITGTMLLAERFDGIGPWSKLEVAFMLGYGQTLAGLLTGFLFGYNLTHISRRVGRGQLDHSLVQPHSLLTTFITEGFMPFSGVGMFLPGVILLVWAISSLQLPPDPSWIALLVAQLIASGAIVMSFHFIWGTLAFWAPRGAEEVTSETHHLMDALRPFPLDGVGAASQGALLSFLPVGFLAWYPSRALLGIDAWPYALALTPAAALVFVLAATLTFRMGLAHYAQTGSSRYSDFGHRR